MATVQVRKRPDTRKIAVAALLASTAAVISLLGLTLPFPLLPFLQFDPAEIPDVLAFFLLGPGGGVAVTSLHWILLNLHGSFDPVIGPTMKFAAVFSTMVGLYIGTYLVPSKSTDKRRYLTLLGTGSVVRFLLMLPPTFLLYYLISPNLYLGAATQALAAFGIHVSGTLAAAIVVTLVTGLYNVVHAILTITGTWLVYRATERSGAVPRSLNWMREQLGTQVSEA